ncbi:hypothetical protein F4819DRAFT_243735 [Hypoxylon fuscum]|nr:hypothetical protein F4819DRAFT_243735 [Hypoxylon fuscum]
MGLGDYIDYATDRRDVYLAAADVDYMLGDVPDFWANGDDVKFLKDTKPVMGIVQYKRPYKGAYRIACDSILWYFDDLRRNARSYQEVHEAKPVIFVAPEVRPCPLWTPAESKAIIPLHQASPTGALKAIIDKFYEEALPVIVPSWRCWQRRFPALSLDNKLSILESIPNIMPVDGRVKVDQRLCIIVGMEYAISKETRDHAKRFVRFLEKHFIKTGGGKILFFVDTPFDLSDMLDDESCVVHLSEDEESSDAYFTPPESPVASSF